MIPYDGDPSGFSGVHYGRDGIGALGSDILAETNAGTNKEGLIQLFVPALDPASEYRIVLNAPVSGLTLNENGSGLLTAGTAQIYRIELSIYENGVQL